MKKWIAGLLTAALLVGIVPAAMAVTTEPKSAVNFKAGYGAVNVTPVVDKTKAGYMEIHIAGNNDTETRIATATDSGNELWMKAIALSDGENIRVVMTTDFIRVPIGWNGFLEDILSDSGDRTQWESKFAYLWTNYSDASGTLTAAVDETLRAKWMDDLLPKYTNKLAPAPDGASLISVSGTHTHSSVDIGDANNSKNVKQEVKWHTSNKNNIVGADGVRDNNSTRETAYFHNYWMPGALEAVSLALQDLSDATIMTKSFAVTDKYGKTNVNRVRHWVVSNGTMNGVNFKTDGVTAKGHPRAADPEMQLIRLVREETTDIVLVNWQMHPTGAMGSINKTLSADYCGVICNYLNTNVDDCVAAYFQGAAGNLCEGTTSGGESAPEIHSGEAYGFRNYGVHLGKQAAAALSSMTAVPAGKVQSLRNETVVVERGYEEYRTVQQDVITVGNAFAVVTAGYEMFDSNAMDVKKATKATFADIRDGKTTTNDGGYGAVFIIENAQGHEYMPDWQTNHYTLLGGPTAYEAKENCFNLVPGSAEDLADGLIYMLQTLNPSIEQ